MPDDFPAAVVVAQHLDPTRESMLQETLAQFTRLPLVTVREHDALVGGTVYVVPANRHVEVSDHHVALSDGESTGPKPSIDRLFTTAASVFRERLLAVVLSGMGSDGGAGARAVKEAGGLVVIEDPKTAAYPQMPLSLPPTIVDIVAPAEQIPGILEEAVHGPAAPRDDEKVLRVFLSFVRERTGIDFNHYKPATILRRLRRLMSAAGAESLSEYMAYLNERPEALQQLVGAFLIKVTEFFRDAALFEHLRNQLIPEIVTRARRSGGEIRIWSAGCATGEEAYSLGILISEILGEELDDFNVRIFATDLDAEAIGYARRGIYPAASLEAMPQEYIDKYFTRVEDLYQVKKRIRNLTVFGEYDLGQRAPFPRIDLALCRNVLIYFTKELQQRTLQLFAFSLTDGGYLVLGKAETTSPAPELFTQIHPSLKVYRRNGDRVQIPSPRITESLPMLQDRLMVRRSTSPLPTRQIARDPSVSARSLTENIGALLYNSPLGLVVVDRHYDILLINSAARTMFTIYGPGVGEDLIHLVSSLPSQELRALIDAAFREGGAGREAELESRETGAPESRFLRISCFPQRDGSRVHSVVMIVLDVTRSVVAQREAQATIEQQRHTIETLSSENAQLLDRQRTLSETNSELTSANMELRTANEHLLISTEEAESAAEEIETLNEEMQATGEELETLNEELQATVEELNTTNEELEARSAELQRTVNEREAQQRRLERECALLDGVLESLQDPIVAVDSRRTVIAANEAYRSLGIVSNEPQLFARATRGTPFTQEVTVLPRDGGAEVQFDAVARPLVVGDGPDGGVIVLIRRAGDSAPAT